MAYSALMCVAYILLKMVGTITSREKVQTNEVLRRSMCGSRREEAETRRFAFSWYLVLSKQTTKCATEQFKKTAIFKMY